MALVIFYLCFSFPVILNKGNKTKFKATSFRKHTFDLWSFLINSYIFSNFKKNTWKKYATSTLVYK